MSKNTQGNDRLTKLAILTGNVSVNQQHALRLVRGDLKALNQAIQSCASEHSARLTNVENLVSSLTTNINTLTASINNVAASNNNSIRVVNSRLDSMDKIIQQLQVAISNTSSEVQTQQPEQLQRRSTPIEPERGETLNLASDRRSQRSTTSSILNQTTDNYDQALITSSNSARKTFMENTLKDLLAQITECISIDISDDTSDALLADCYTKTSPALKQDIDRVNKAIDAYLDKFQTHDELLVENTNTILRKARVWMSLVQQKYKKDEVYQSSKESSSIITLNKFEPDAEFTIFEFITKFE